MISYKQSFDILEKQISQYLRNDQPKELYDPIRYLLSIGGKRLRPCLAVMAFSLFDTNLERIIAPALGLEVFHNFTLMHDDIMDKAHRRRNFDTVHIKWNENTAILSGDAMMIVAYKLIAQTPDNTLPKVLELFNRTALEVCEGQQYDMNFETSDHVTIEQYLEMIRLKTAVLLAASLSIGGVIAGAKPTDISALYEFGINIGMAFQLQDDYLDVFARDEKFGKSIGGDIVANKKTFLLISALQSGEKKWVDELRSWLQKNTLDPAEKIAAVRNIYLQLKIDEKTRELSQSYFEKGLHHLNTISAHDRDKKELSTLVNLLMNREH